MPKLTKEKFNIDGSYTNVRTTSSYDIELYLYYSTVSNNFYFDKTEYIEKIPHLSQLNLDFKGCKSRDEAMNLMKVAISNGGERKRKLRIEISVCGDFGKMEKSDLFEHFQKMVTYNGGNFRNIHYDVNTNEREFSIKFDRLEEVELNGTFVYIYCDENWNNKGGRINISKWNTNLIDWDEQTEKFLINIQLEMDKVSTKIVNFFNTESADILKLKISNGSNLLGS